MTANAAENLRPVDPAQHDLRDADARQAASVRNVVAMGPRAGRPLRKIVLPGLARAEGRRTHERGENGFDLDVGPVVRADERARLERLCRYLLWPPLASERLELLPDVLECSCCGGRMKIITTVTDPEAVRKILTCIGLPARPPPVAPAREREQAELGFEG